MIRTIQRTVMCVVMLGALTGQVKADILDVLLADTNYIDEIETNDSLADAQDINNAFSSSSVGSGIIADIHNTNTSTLIPHATIKATGNNTFDYFSFEVTVDLASNPLGTLGIFDIDYGFTSEVEDKGGHQIDTVLGLYASNGDVLAYNGNRPRYTTFFALPTEAIINPDHFAPVPAHPPGLFPLEHDAAGSKYVDSKDAFLQYRFLTPGTYIIGVGRVDGQRTHVDNNDGHGTFYANGGLTGDPLLDCTNYVLHVSVENHPTTETIIPEPTSMAIFGIGACCMGLGALRRRRKEKQAETV